MEKVQLENSDEILWVHPSSACAGEYCTIHNRSDHVMRSFPQHWRADRAIMERICPHGVGHPDPDEYMLTINKHEGIHGCDGCCEEAKLCNHSFNDDDVCVLCGYDGGARYMK